MGVPRCPMPTPHVWVWEIDQVHTDQTPRRWCVGNRATELRIQWVVPMFWQIDCKVVRSVP